MNPPEQSNPAINKKRQALIARLKRIEGQTRGLQKLIANSDDCEKVAQQLAATRKALDKTFYEAIACMMEQELGQENEAAHRYTRLLAKYA